MHIEEDGAKLRYKEVSHESISSSRKSRIDPDPIEENKGVRSNRRVANLMGRTV